MKLKVVKTMKTNNWYFHFKNILISNEIQSLTSINREVFCVVPKITQ